MAAAHLFMKLINPGKSVIQGESQVDGYEGQIVLDDWSWGVNRKKEKDKPDVVEPSVFSFSKSLDRSTTALLSCLRSGQVLPSATVTLEEYSEVEFKLVITMKDIRVQGYDLDGQVSDVDAQANEKWVFSYHTIEFNYQPTKSMASGLRGTLAAVLTRPPGASSTPVNEHKDKLLTTLRTVPEQNRKSLWNEIGQQLDSLGGEKK